MNLLRDGIKVTKHVFLVSIFLFFSFFTLNVIFSSYIPELIISASNRLLVQASINFVIAVTLFVNSFWVDRINETILIRSSSIAVTLMTILLLVAPNNFSKIALLFGIGIFFSLGLLGVLTYFWKLTGPEERGRIAGVIGFIAFPLNFIVVYLVAPGLDFLGIIIVSIIISSGILSVFLMKPKNAVPAKKKERNYFEKKTMALYTIPWILFSIVNVTLAKNASLWISQQVSSSFYLFLLAIQFVGVIFGCLLGGIIADLFGRRSALVVSLTSYGASAAMVGLFSTSNEMLSFVYVVNGLSWGILFTLYIFVVWGDLANENNCGKMFSLGLATYYSSIGIGLLTSISVSIVASSLATCLLVFLSNIPIAIAPELLSPHFRETTKIKLHIKAVKKMKKPSDSE